MLSTGWRGMEMYLRDIFLPELIHLIRSEFLDSPQQPCSIGAQSGDIHLAADIGQQCQFFQSAGKQSHGSTIFVSSPVVKGDSDLQDTLIKTAERLFFGHPQFLKGLVTGEILPSIELHDAAQQTLRRSVMTGLDHIES